jgi:hypothetical protein
VPGAPAADPDANGHEADDGAPIERYDDLDAEEIVALIGSMESADLLALRDHERDARARPRILVAIDGVLASREAAHRP